MNRNDALLYGKLLNGYQESLNRALEIIQAELPDDLAENRNGKIVYRCCWPLVAILIDMQQTAVRLMDNGELEDQRDDTDNRYDIRPVMLGRDG